MECLACVAKFDSVEQQRIHYRSEWHRYNLQRQVAELPCVSERDFNDKLQLQSAEADSQRVPAAEYHCEVCLKHFLSENVLRDHLTSKKHLVRLAQVSKSGNKPAKGGKQRPAGANEGRKQTGLDSAPEVNIVSEASKKADVTNIEDKRTKRDSVSSEEASGSDAESWESDAIGFEECLFCGLVSESFESNLTHMERAHLFYIPDVAFCVDLEALFSSIAERITMDNECLWCFRRLRSKRAAQQHMLAKQHCRLRYEDEYILEYADFYDYERSEEDGTKASEKEAGSNSEVRYAMTPAEREELLALLASDDAFELVLPSGVTIGHRSLVRYYKQRLTDRELQSGNAGRLHIGAGLARSAITYRPQSAKSQRSVMRPEELAALERRARDVMHIRRQLQDHAMRLGVQANKLQRHFRKQML